MVLQHDRSKQPPAALAFLWLSAARFKPLLFPLALQSRITQCSCGVALVTLPLARADLSNAIGDIDRIVAGLPTNALKIN